LLTPRVDEALAEEPYTDVFLMSHGWMGDAPAAVRQYDRWIGAMAACEDDLERASRVRPGFRPLLIRLHWPSLPFRAEDLVGLARLGRWRQGTRQFPTHRRSWTPTPSESRTRRRPERPSRRSLPRPPRTRRRPSFHRRSKRRIGCSTVKPVLAPAARPGHPAA